VTRKRNIFAVLASLLVIAGCGSSSSGVSANSYVKSVCGAIKPFVTDIQARSNSLNLTSLSSPAQGKQALEGFMTAAVADSQKAVDQLKAAGVPNVNNGKNISNALVDAFTKVKSALSAAQSQAAALPTGSVAAFRTAGQSLATTIRTSFASIGAGLGGLKSAELSKAAKSTPACQSIGA
jgi:hypothetical protein